MQIDDFNFSVLTVLLEKKKLILTSQSISSYACKVEMKAEVIYNICIFVTSMCIYTTCNYLNIITSWCIHLKNKQKRYRSDLLQADVARKTVAAPETSSDQQCSYKAVELLPLRFKRTHVLHCRNSTLCILKIF